ncbi:MAG: LPS export ABC transporter ATP-binding protein [Chlamydiota bacterium]
MTILKVVDLIKSYGGKKVVNGLSFKVSRGQIVGLLGPNGAGKTTAFYMAIGLICPDKGKIFFGDRDVTAAPVHKRARMGMGYLAQDPSVFRQLTVEQNIRCILETLPLTRAQRKRQLAALLEELNLTLLAKKKASTLSGGERRRLEITRALVTNPTLLLLDEPFANIDPITVQEVKALIRHLKKKNISILITDHNAREVSSIVDHTYLVQEGKVTHQGTMDELLAHPVARSTYFGEDFTL